MEEYSKVNASEYAQMPIGERILGAELSTDLTLPDYQPEIKRLLKICASVLPPSKYIGDRQAEFAGNIDYYVYYTASDNEIYCAPLTGEYKIDVPVEIDPDSSVSNLTGAIDIQPDMISGRVISPRKINVKCRLKAQATIFGDIQTGRSFDTDAGNEVLTGIIPVTRTLYGTGDMHRLSDEMIIDQRLGEVRVISASGNTLISEISCADGNVNCRGDVYLKLLMVREGGGAPYTTVRKLPFSQSVSVEGAAGRCQASAVACVCETNIEVEDSRILIDLGIITDVTVRKIERVRYIKDVYSTVYKTECQYKPLKVYTNGTAFGANFTFGDSASLSEVAISPECLVIDCSGVASLESVICEGARMTASGKAKFTLLMDKNGEYICSDVEMPFKYSADVGDLGENAVNNLRASVISSRARIDGERVGVDAEITLCGGFYEPEDINMLDGVSFGEEINRGRGEIVMCYPGTTDSLWSVAKRYGKNVSELLMKNKISNEAQYDAKESLDGVNYLIV